MRMYPRGGCFMTISLASSAAMAGSDHTALQVTARPVEGSRSTRRLRKRGLVPGVVYGGGSDPVPFSVDALTLRATLAHAGAVLDLEVDGGGSTPVIVKDVQNHPVRGEAIHVDLLRVDMNTPIHAVVVLELTGGEEAPGVTEGGVLSQETRELNIEALPDDIPDSITHDVSGLEMNETLTLSVVSVPQGVTLLDDPEETVIATITPPTQEPVEEEIETETELVGEDGEPIEGAVEGDEAESQAEGATGEEAASASDDES
jgi:large subunit ribosomal protein L25